MMLSRLRVCFLEWFLLILQNYESFLGLARYYKRFVEGFSKIVAPLTQLTHKDQPFIWTYRCDISFEELKRSLLPHQC